jgi:GMP synthase (glutamine-hydrolysing)
MLFIIIDNGDPYSVSSLQYILSERGLPSRTLPHQGSYDAVAWEDVSGVFFPGGSPDLNVCDPDIASKVPLDVACLANCTMPIMGICFGFELLVQLAGGEIGDLPTPLPEQCVSIRILRQEGIFTGLPGTVCMRQYNTQGAVRVPSSFVVTACSERSPFEAVQHRWRPIYATQFHPEAQDPEGNFEPWGRRIVENFIDICLLVGKP